VLDAENLELIP
jgi:hypothetical protein